MLGIKIELKQYCFCIMARILRAKETTWREHKNKIKSSRSFFFSSIIFILFPFCRLCRHSFRSFLFWSLFFSPFHCPYRLTFTSPFLVNMICLVSAFKTVVIYHLGKQRAAKRIWTQQRISLSLPVYPSASVCLCLREIVCKLGASIYNNKWQMSFKENMTKQNRLAAKLTERNFIFYRSFFSPVLTFQFFFFVHFLD